MPSENAQEAVHEFVRAEARRNPGGGRWNKTPPNEAILRALLFKFLILNEEDPSRNTEAR